MNSLEHYRGRVVWLTGAGSGIGAALAVKLAAAGAKLALTSRRRSALEEVAARAAPATPLIAPADVTDPAAVAQAVSAIRTAYGTVDLLIANAGSYQPTEAVRFDVSEYEAAMRLNYFGALNCIQAVLPEMLERGEGQLAAVSSVAAYRALPKAASYGASKAALSYFMDSLRFDLEPRGVKVTVVSPGFVRTPLTDRNSFPMPCLIEPDEAAECILQGIARGSYEVHFPRRFSGFLKALRLLPYPLYHKLIARRVAGG